MRLHTFALVVVPIAVVSLIAGPVAIAGPSQAATVDNSKIHITKIYYNAPGSDLPATNDKINAEYVTLTNTDSQARAITNWTLRDTAGHVFTIPSFTIASGDYVNIHSGAGTTSPHRLFWGNSYYIWNNDGDTATLRNTSSVGGDQCSYSGGGSYTTC